MRHSDYSTYYKLPIMAIIGLGIMLAPPHTPTVSASVVSRRPATGSKPQCRSNAMDLPVQAWSIMRKMCSALRAKG